jgi:hypothetical protein
MTVAAPARSTMLVFSPIERIPTHPPTGIFEVSRFMAILKAGSGL